MLILVAAIAEGKEKGHMDVPRGLSLIDTVYVKPV